MLEKTESGRKIRKDSFESIVGPERLESILLDMYCDKLLSTTQMSVALTDMFDMHIGAVKVYSMLNRLGVIRSKSEALSIRLSTEKNSVEVDAPMRAIVDGMLLGDGSLSINGRGDRARLSIGSVHKEFASYCRSLLSPMISSEPEYRPAGEKSKGGRGMWSTHTIYQDALADIYKKWYIDGVKIVPPDVNLDPMSLLLWYLGDGSMSAPNETNSRSLYFSTNSFSRDDIINILCKGMEERYGIKHSRVTRDNRLFIKTKSIWPLLKVMGGESPVECFSYKFDIEEWRTWESMRNVAAQLDIDYARLANWVKNGKIDHNRSPGGKKVMFDENQISTLLSRIESGELPREAGKKARVPIIHAAGNLQSKQMRCRSDETHDEFIDRVIKTYQADGFPYVKMGRDDIVKKWTAIKKSQYITPDEDIVKWRTPGLSLAEFFHPHIYDVYAGKNPPSVVFSNRDLFRKSLEMFMKCSGKDYLTYTDVRRALCRFGSRKVNSFSPEVVRDLINFYGFDGCSVFDPCAGYSGRLLGTVASKHYPSYFGIDPCSMTCDGLLSTAEFLTSYGESSDVNIVNGRAESVVKVVGPSTFDIAISSPPYWNKEQYSNESTQSCNRYKTYGEWLDGFLEPVISGCFRVLKPGGVFIYNVGECRSNDIPNDSVTIATESGFVVEDRKEIRFKKAFASEGDDQFFSEPLFIFRKP